MTRQPRVAARAPWPVDPVRRCTAARRSGQRRRPPRPLPAAVAQRSRVRHRTGAEGCSYSDISGCPQHGTSALSRASLLPRGRDGRERAKPRPPARPARSAPARPAAGRRGARARGGDPLRPLDHARRASPYHQIIIPVLVEVERYLKGDQPEQRLLLAVEGGVVGPDCAAPIRTDAWYPRDGYVLDGRL